MKKYVITLLVLVAIFSSSRIFGQTHHGVHHKKAHKYHGHTAYHKAKKLPVKHEETVSIATNTPTTVVSIQNGKVYVNDEHVMTMGDMRNEDSKILISHEGAPSAAVNDNDGDDDDNKPSCGTALGVCTHNYIDEGAMISYVMPCSPACKAGLMPGDVIMSIDKQDVHNSKELSSTVCGHRAGDKVTVAYMHFGHMECAQAELADNGKIKDSDCNKKCCHSSCHDGCRSSCYPYYGHRGWFWWWW